MIKFIEVISETNFSHRSRRHMLSPGTADSEFRLGEVWINEKYVVSVREAPDYHSLLQEGLLPSDLNEGHSFTMVVTNNGQVTQSHVVVGTPTIVANRLHPAEKELLKG